MVEREAIARIIDPSAWAHRDDCLHRRDAWDDHLSVAWNSMTFEQWCERGTGSSLTKADAVIDLISRPSPHLPDDAAALVARLFAAIAHGDEAHRAWLKNALNAFFELPENMPSLAAPVGDAGGWIAGSADGNRFRTWKDGYAAWTDDRNEATRYARRIDAEAVHAEDEDAWRVLPLAAPRPVGEELVEVVAMGLCEHQAERGDLSDLKPWWFDRQNQPPGTFLVSGVDKEMFRDFARAALRSLPSREEE